MTYPYFHIASILLSSQERNELFRIGLVGLGRAERIVPKVFDEDGIYDIDEDIGFGKPDGDRLIVSPSMLCRLWFSHQSS